MPNIILDQKQGLIYTTPSIPNEKDILYYDLPKKEQYWRTSSDLKNQLTLKNPKKMSHIDRVEYVTLWRTRWLEGMWFMNDGEPVYLSPMNVDHLVFNKFSGRNLNYNENQRDDFYFRHLIWEMEDVDGMMWEKPRRYGMTAEEVTQSIWVALSGDRQNVALMSDTLDIAKKTLLAPLIDTYMSRPSWMAEEYWIPGGKRPKGSLELVSNTIVKDDESNTLGSLIYAFATKAKGADSTENMYVVQDEFSKYESGINPRQTLEANKKTIRNAGRYGKTSALSTTGDNDQQIQSINEWIKLSGESILRPGERGSISGLVKRFVSAVWSQWLPSELLPNKNGKIDIGRNEEWVTNEVNKKPKGTKEWYYEKRKLPLSEDDALVGAAGVHYFDKIRIVSRRKFLEGLPIDQKPYVRGILEEDYAGKVHFKSDAERRAESGEFIEPGGWLIAIHPYYSVERSVNTANRFRKFGNVYFPPLNPEGGIGFDPTRYRREDTTSNHLSRACIIVGKKYDYFGAGDANRYAALYVGRQDDPEDDHRECVKAAKYWAYPVMHERQVESVKKVFEECNMLPFLQKDEGGKIHGIWTDPAGKVVKNGVDMLVTRFKVPKTKDVIDQVDEYPFEDGLIDLDNFDLANTTKFDVMMAMIMLEHGLKQVEYTNITEEISNQLREVMDTINPIRKGSGQMV